MIEDARSQAVTIASEQEIVRISQQQADTIWPMPASWSARPAPAPRTTPMRVFRLIDDLDTLLNNTHRCRDRLNAAR